jgi:hypothetical protein
VKKGKRGRPVGPLGRRGAVMGLRLPIELKELLEQAAAESGRTISGELLWRLSLTFRGHERGESLGQVLADVEKTMSEAQGAIVQMRYGLERIARRRHK